MNHPKPLRALFTAALVIDCALGLAAFACIAFVLTRAFWAWTAPTAREMAEIVSTDVAPAVVEWAETRTPGRPEPVPVLDPATAVPGNPFMDAQSAERLEASRLKIAIDAARMDLQRSSPADAPARRARLDSLEALLAQRQGAPPPR